LISNPVLDKSGMVFHSCWELISGVLRDFLFPFCGEQKGVLASASKESGDVLELGSLWIVGFEVIQQRRYIGYSRRRSWRQDIFHLLQIGGRGGCGFAILILDIVGVF
jgi:hypothetical protein